MLVKKIIGLLVIGLLAQPVLAKEPKGARSFAKKLMMDHQVGKSKGNKELSSFMKGFDDNDFPNISYCKMLIHKDIQVGSIEPDRTKTAKLGSGEKVYKVIAKFTAKNIVDSTFDIRDRVTYGRESINQPVRYSFYIYKDKNGKWTYMERGFPCQVINIKKVHAQNPAYLTKDVRKALGPLLGE